MGVTTTIFEAEGFEVFENTSANMTLDPEDGYVEVEFRDPENGIVYTTLSFDRGVLRQLADAEDNLFVLAAR